MSQEEVPVITLDGPSGVGKGTVGQKLAQILGWHYLDSGAIYRALAFAAGANHIAVDDVPSLVRLAQSLDLSFRPDPEDVCRVIHAGRDITSEVRNEACGRLASDIAKIPEIRAALVRRQHAFKAMPGLIADGRDMGTTIFPEAGTKIYMTAEAKVRAERRLKQLKIQGKDAKIGGVLFEIQKRDEQDSSRRASPLLPAKDAVVLDTGDLNIDQVVRRVLDIHRGRGNMGGLNGQWAPDQ